MLSFIISSVLILLIYVAAWLEGWPEWTLVVIFPAIYWLSLFFLLIYKAWKAIQWEGATRICTLLPVLRSCVGGKSIQSKFGKGAFSQKRIL